MLTLAQKIVIVQKTENAVIWNMLMWSTILVCQLFMCDMKAKKPPQTVDFVASSESMSTSYKRMKRSKPLLAQLVYIVCSKVPFEYPHPDSIACQINESLL